MTIPSKELLTAVLDKNVTWVKCEGDPKEIDIEIAGYDIEYFNIYELMHLMKEWIEKQRYKNISGNNCLIGNVCSIVRIMTDDDWINFQAPTEFEAVTKACEWVLKEIK